jgi:hypothetical protein
VLRLVGEWEGIDLMPELGHRPTNRYRSPRKREATATAGPPITLEPMTADGGLFGRVDRLLSR